MKMPDGNPDIEDALKNWRPTQHKASERFVNDVMRRVNALPTPRPWWRSLFDLRSFEFQLRPAIAIASIFILGIGIGYWINRAPAPSPEITVVIPEEKRHQVKFIYMDPLAKSVAVIGDFNHWQQTPLHRLANGLWTLSVPIAEGDYDYQFVIDGKKFVTDPTAPEKDDDGFGHANSVLSL